jgi:hypothetical protein
MGNSPFFTAVALLLWCIPVQSVAATVVAIPSLIAVIGILELLVALACSYLILTEEHPVTARSPVLTDITFPAEGESFPVPINVQEPLAGRVVAHPRDDLGVVGSIRARIRRTLGRGQGPVKRVDSGMADGLPAGNKPGGMRGLLMRRRS